MRTAAGAAQHRYLSGIDHGDERRRLAVFEPAKRGQGGSIIITSSVAGLFGFPNVGSYSSAKHGIVGLMRTLTQELAPYMIRVNSVHPTNVNTPMIMNDAAYRLIRPDLENPQAEDMGAVMVGSNALPVPWVEPVDISNAVLWLASEEARYVTGVTLPIDAGFCAKVGGTPAAIAE